MGVDLGIRPCPYVSSSPSLFRLRVPGQPFLRGDASDGLDPLAGRHPRERLHGSGRQGAPQGQGGLSHLLLARHVVRHAAGGRDGQDPGYVRCTSLEDFALTVVK